ncbi:MAG TPA: hypothetical protein VMC79_02335 [Rectinemataceae bacterium]|nr:hypothetical protein [Rectinemataceae bacterium]
MHAFGAMGFATYQLCLSDSLAVNGSGAILGMLGDKYNFLLTQVPVHANLVFKAFEADATSYFLFGGAGGSVGLSSMTVGIPVAANVTDDTTFDTLTLTGSATFGGQCTITLGKFVLSPFGIYTYTAGSYSYSQISSMSYAYPSGSGSIHGYSTTVLGFDLLYKPLNVSLSSLFQNTDRYSLVSIALKWILSRG